VGSGQAIHCLPATENVVGALGITPRCIGTFPGAGVASTRRGAEAWRAPHLSTDRTDLEACQVVWGAYREGIAVWLFRRVLCDSGRPCFFALVSAVEHK
jgi:hypothetical protein